VNNQSFRDPPDNILVNSRGMPVRRNVRRSLDAQFGPKWYNCLARLELIQPREYTQEFITMKPGHLGT